MFRTPLEALHNETGLVQCGSCTEVFVGLKYALLLDAPLVQPQETQSIVVAPARSYGKWYLVVITLLLSLFLLWSVDYALRQGGIFTLEQSEELSKAYKYLQIPVVPYMELDTLNITGSSLRRDNDNYLNLSFTIHNSSMLPVQWPQLLLTLKANDGSKTKDLRLNLPGLKKGTGSNTLKPNEDAEFEFSLPPHESEGLTEYRLELTKQILP